MSKLRDVLSPPKITLPHSLDAERAVLGSLMIKPLAMSDVETVLEIDDFFLPAHREIYQSMLNVSSQDHPLDIIALTNDLRMRDVLRRLDSGEMYLLKLSNETPTAENVRYYASLVREKSALRKLIGQCLETVTLASTATSFDELMDDHRGRVDAIDATPETGPERIGEILGPMLDDMQKRQDAEHDEQEKGKPSPFKITTGHVGLDEALGGWFPGDLDIIAARPSVGKTALALDCAKRAAIAGVPELFFSLEMAKYQMGQRALASAARVAGDDMRRVRLGVEEWKAINKVGLPKLADIPLWFDDRPDLTFERLRAEAIRWALKVDPDALHKDKLARKRKMVWIDSMSLLNPQRERSSRQQDVRYISRGLKKLAQMLYCPIGLIVHLGRDVEKGKGGHQRRPKMSDLREAGEIEQDADVILFPYRTVQPSRTGPVDVTFIIDKNRHGATADVLASFDARYMSFHEALDDDGPI